MVTLLIGQSTPVLTTTISKQAKYFPRRQRCLVYPILIYPGRRKNRPDLLAAIALHRQTNME
jgi:hypothetical protein